MRNFGIAIMVFGSLGLPFETIDLAALEMQLMWWAGCFTVIYAGYRVYRAGDGRSVRDIYRQPE